MPQELTLSVRMKSSILGGMKSIIVWSEFGMVCRRQRPHRWATRWERWRDFLLIFY